MKKEIKIYLETEDIEKLKRKAEELGYVGRGSVSHYIEKIAREPIAFIDSNVKAIFEVLRLKPA